ncbi:MAG TPA: ArsR family transcriptional regulator [Candidatus Dormibacteraeota bacterium]|jgi:protein-tyrosine-phosphatase|nr:ArsR family transcriptional regulator [Candidatus Dormibacteraeota bacterium]
MVQQLVEGDLRGKELVALTGRPPNLVTYHLAQLRAEGLVSVRRSAADGRDSYFALDLDAVGRAMEDVAAALGIRRGLHASLAAAFEPNRPASTARVLFICTGNSSRSQMAEGWLRHLGGPQMVACSAGTAPTQLHPLAVTAMREHGVDIARQVAKPVSVFVGQRFDRVITLCDRAREACAELPPARAAAHWSIPNPSEMHPPDLDAYRATARELETRVRHLLARLGRSLP